MPKPRKRSTTAKTRTARKSGARKSKTTPAQTILAWEDDPQSPDKPASPVSRAVPSLGGPYAIAIHGAAPAAREYPRGSKEFRYWAAAEALSRGAGFWAGIVPTGTRWFTGASLPVTLDAGVDLNAY